MAKWRKREAETEIWQITLFRAFGVLECYLGVNVSHIVDHIIIDS